MRRVKDFWVFGVFAALSLLITTGCGGGTADVNRPQPVPATGTVTYNGEPVAGATVTLVPQDEGRGAVGKTDASGQFTLTTYEAGDGAIPGSYRVTVAKTVAGGIPEGDVVVEMDASDGPTAEDDEAKEMLPEKWKDPETSGLTAEIKQGGDDTLNLELTD